MRIGQAPASARQQAGGARLNQPIEGRTPNFSGGGDGGASALFSAAGALAGAANSLYEEDQKKRDFGALQMYNRTVGEYDRWQTEMFTTAPPDGTGVSAASAQEWDKRFNTFLSNIDPDLQPRYTAIGETVKQDFLKRGEETERAALRGNSLFTLEEIQRQAANEILADPVRRDGWEQRYVATLETAPGLTDADRRQLAQRGLDEIGKASAQGRLFLGEKAKRISPDDEASFIPLVNAVVSAESAGNPVAISPAGAAGIMQVMPATARDIAREIGDPNFPAGENDAVVQEYLKNETIGRRYGTYYLRKRLRQLGGDTEAALIAYNAGIGNARRWLAAGRDYSVLPKREETEPYARGIMERLGAVTEEEIFADENLDPDTRLQLASAARGQAVQVETEAAAEFAANRATAIVALNDKIDNYGGMPAIHAAVESGLIAPGSKEYDAAVSRYQKVEEDNIAVAQTVKTLADPNGNITADKKGRDSLSLMVEKLGALESIAQGDDDAFNSGVLPLWVKTGVAPTNVKQTLEGMMQSTNAGQVQFAYRSLSALYANRADDFVREFGKDTTELIEWYRAMGSAGNTEFNAGLELMQNRTPEARQRRTELETLAGENLKSAKRAPDALRSEFSAFVGGNAAFGDIAAQGVNAASLWSDYNATYKRLFPLYGEDRATHNAVIESISKMYGRMVPGDDNTLVKYPPAQFAPTFDGGHEWYMAQFNREHSVADGDTVRVVNNSINADRLVATGQLPVHDYIIQRANGEMEVVRDWRASPETERTYRETLARETPGGNAAMTREQLEQAKLNFTGIETQIVALAREYANTNDEAYRTQLRTFISDLERQMPVTPDKQSDPLGPSREMLQAIVDDMMGKKPLAPEFMAWLSAMSPGGN